MTVILLYDDYDYHLGLKPERERAETSSNKAPEVADFEPTKVMPSIPCRPPHLGNHGCN